VTTEVEPSVLDRLDDKERRFVEGVCAGMSGVEAARYCGHGTEDRNALAAYASKLKKRVHIREAIEELREQHRVENEDLWSETLRALRELIREKSNPNARARACELMARLLGKLQPERHEHVHAHLELPSLNEAETRQELVRLTRITLDALPAEERAALVREALATEPLTAIPATIKDTS
jgi:hypothetical protein